MTQTTTRTYTVQGMTCDHCRGSVTEEVSEVEGVETVQVHLTSGRLEVCGGDVADNDVTAAVEEAGYRLAADR